MNNQCYTIGGRWIYIGDINSERSGKYILGMRIMKQGRESWINEWRIKSSIHLNPDRNPNQIHIDQWFPIERLYLSIYISWQKVFINLILILVSYFWYVIHQTVHGWIVSWFSPMTSRTNSPAIICVSYSTPLSSTITGIHWNQLILIAINCN